MGNDVAEVEQVLPYSAQVKVHSLMYRELTKFLDRIIHIFPDIESARPGCMSGIQALCALNLAIEKAKLLLQHCAESSKLYLAITGEAIQLRFDRARKALVQSLTKVQNMVPQPLAMKISAIVNDLQDAKFVIDSSEEEAGGVVLALLRHDRSATDSMQMPEFEAFQIAAIRLHITSPKALVIEKRSIKKLLDKVRDTDQRKENILKYLLYLLSKYGNLVGCEQAESADAQWKDPLSIMNSACNSGQCEKTDESVELRQHRDFDFCEAQSDVSRPDMPPEEFKCPISSKLMFDPVVIASGQTFERIWIEKWFSEGHDTCPKTQKKLSHFSLTPNSCLKDLISKWCREHNVTIQNPCLQSIPEALSSWNTSYSSSFSSFGSSFNVKPTLLDNRTSDYINQSDTSNISISSFDTSNCLDSSHTNSIESLKDNHTQISSWNDGSDRSQSFADFSQEMYSDFLSKLGALPLEFQLKAVDDVKIFLKRNDEACHSMHSNGFVEALMRFLMDARDLSNVEAQRTGAQVLLAFVSNIRNGTPPLHEDAFQLLASFLDSEISKEALAIMQVLTNHQSFKSKIMASGALPSLIKILGSQVNELQVQAVKVLCDLSSHSDFRSHILSSGCIAKLVQLLGDGVVTGNCIKILQNVCDTEEARVAIFETNGCIESISELLDTGTRDEQEHAVAVLLSICSHSSDCCHSVMNEGVIPALVNISINGNMRGKESAMKLLQLLRDLRHNDPLDSSLQVGSDAELSRDSGSSCKEKQPALKSSNFFKRKMSIFTRRKSLALF
ncbi:U-box domain-containing protein 6-like isoform X2 [Magnolia sinica]|uniref:U-box domain-containing protein 6-like isoform X2 n=1 Tax=Magnolia sinica TaxID=86752 RepID=UPI00265AC433|nr:U-box domain-containing protein 6-like isoform X2 [Magnolia sinica]